MMILRASLASPFVRKVRMAIAMLGLDGQVELGLADTNNPEDSLRRQNPLGKIPALILETGETIFDSRVIVEYLDELSGGGKIIPPAGRARLDALLLQALGDGVCDAAILQVYEQRLREPQERSKNWVALQAGKIERALVFAEKYPPRADDQTIGAVALACALGYLDLRFAGAWRKECPKLVAWLDGFSARTPSFEATRFRG